MCGVYMFGVYIPILHICMYNMYSIHVNYKFNNGSRDA